MKIVGEELINKFKSESANIVVGDLYKHLKSGNLYVIVGCGFIESTCEMAVIYQRYDSSDVPVTWIRPSSEFFDGRFEFFNNSN